MSEIAVVGAGAWGTALANVVASAGNDVKLWARDEGLADIINSTNENTKYLPGIKIKSSIQAFDNFGEFLDQEALVMVVPAQYMRGVCQQLRGEGLNEKAVLVLCCKGIEDNTQKMMSEVVAEILPNNPIAVLSGPNFAAEIAKGLPACATLACEDEALGKKLIEQIGSQNFRIYYSSDVIGAQIGGAVKNVLAIACGIATGKGLGENARAALITRGLAEISRLCEAKGGKAETLMGLSGVGDIMLTCGSQASRNMSLGFEIGQGKSLEDIIASRNSVAEGVVTAKSVMALAEHLGVQMPICQAVRDVLHDGQDVDSVMKSLLSRPLGAEG